jgi:DNA-binding transcriptional LysR family regulator
MIPRLKTFLTEHPDLDLEVVLDDRIIDLVQEGIDVAFRMGTLSDSSLTARRIGRGKRLVIGTPSYFKHAGTPRMPGDLIGHQAIAYLQEGSSITASNTIRRLRSKAPQFITDMCA